MMARPHDWIFSWREPARSPFPMLLAAVIAGLLFATVFASVRVRVPEPAPWTARKASLFYLPPDADGRAWELRAKESGPFPSRFDPAGWEGLAALEKTAFAAASPPPPPYVPALRDLPDEEPLPRPPLAATGDPVFPKRVPLPRETPGAAGLKTAPALYPISGISMKEMPVVFPPFEGVEDVSTAAVPGEFFLLRLRPGGGVAECVSLAGGDGSSALEKWLLAVKFSLPADSPERWISVAVALTNQPADGPDAR